MISNVISTLFSAPILAAAAATGEKVPAGFVVLMGMGTVFVGLICIVVLCTVMSRLCRLGQKREPQTPPAAPAANAPAAPAPAAPQEVTAAVSAALAEAMGTEVEAIRITSVKRI